MSIDRMRNATAKAAIECRADYVLFLDDDVIINPNHGLKHLIDCDADCAAGKVVIRGYPFDYMVFKWQGKKNNRGLVARKTLPKSGIHDFDAVGFSFCLLKTAIFKRLPSPWFVTGLNNTEDIYFCMKARELDPDYSIRVNCDCDCGHILWPEVMDTSNRKQYARYYRSINPQPKKDKKADLESCWHGEKYLMRIKEITRNASQQAKTA